MSQILIKQGLTFVLKTFHDNTAVAVAHKMIGSHSERGSKVVLWEKLRILY